MFGLPDTTAGMGTPMPGKRADGKSRHASMQFGRLLDIITGMAVTYL